MAYFIIATSNHYKSIRTLARKFCTYDTNKFLFGYATVYMPAVARLLCGSDQLYFFSQPAARKFKVQFIWPSGNACRLNHFNSNLLPCIDRLRLSGYQPFIGCLAG